jgi:hypothetical protein
MTAVTVLGSLPIVGMAFAAKIVKGRAHFQFVHLALCFIVFMAGATGFHRVGGLPDILAVLEIVMTLVALDVFFNKVLLVGKFNRALFMLTFEHGVVNEFFFWNVSRPFRRHGQADQYQDGPKAGQDGKGLLSSGHTVFSLLIGYSRIREHYHNYRIGMAGRQGAVSTRTDTFEKGGPSILRGWD